MSPPPLDTALDMAILEIKLIGRNAHVGEIPIRAECESALGRIDALRNGREYRGERTPLPNEPVARAHVTSEDDGLFAHLEVLDGAELQPAMSPVPLFTYPPDQRLEILRLKQREADLLGANNRYLQRARDAEAGQDRLKAALQRIVRWFGEFPETGKFWDTAQTQPMSYSSCYGSNGERDFMRGIAQKALDDEEAEPI